VSATVAARSLGDLLARVRYRGESFVIRRGRTVVAELRPPPATGPTGAELAGWWPARTPLRPAEADLLSRELRAARRAVNKPPRSPWPR
jgi:hypothetical protein